jgi:LysR family glycine cleavage system transcriptional activator
MGDARFSTEAALQGQGVALGDTITAAKLLAEGELLVPFDLSVPANDAFYVARRHEMWAAPIVRVFIEWLFASLDADLLPEPTSLARTILRGAARNR